LPSTKIAFRFICIAFMTILAVYFLLPTLLNYPPESINTAFDLENLKLTIKREKKVIQFMLELLFPQD